MGGSGGWGGPTRLRTGFLSGPIPTSQAAVRMGEERPSPTRSRRPGATPHSDLHRGGGRGGQGGEARGLDVRASGLPGSHPLGQPLFCKVLYDGLEAADSCFSRPPPTQQLRGGRGGPLGAGRVLLLGAAGGAEERQMPCDFWTPHRGSMGTPSFPLIRDA